MSKNKNHSLARRFDNHVVILTGQKVTDSILIKEISLHKKIEELKKIKNLPGFVIPYLEAQQIIDISKIPHSFSWKSFKELCQKFDQTKQCFTKKKSLDCDELIRLYFILQTELSYYFCLIQHGILQSYNTYLLEALIAKIDIATTTLGNIRTLLQQQKSNTIDEIYSATRHDYTCNLLYVSQPLTKVEISLGIGIANIGTVLINSIANSHNSSIAVTRKVTSTEGRDVITIMKYPLNGTVFITRLTSTVNFCYAKLHRSYTICSNILTSLQMATPDNTKPELRVDLLFSLQDEFENLQVIDEQDLSIGEKVEKYVAISRMLSLIKKLDFKIYNNNPVPVALSETITKIVAIKNNQSLYESYILQLILHFTTLLDDFIEQQLQYSFSDKYYILQHIVNTCLVYRDSKTPEDLHIKTMLENFLINNKKKLLSLQKDIHTNIDLTDPIFILATPEQDQELLELSPELFRSMIVFSYNSLKDLMKKKKTEEATPLPDELEVLKKTIFESKDMPSFITNLNDILETFLKNYEPNILPKILNNYFSSVRQCFDKFNENNLLSLSINIFKIADHDKIKNYPSNYQTIGNLLLDIGSTLLSRELYDSAFLVYSKIIEQNFGKEISDRATKGLKEFCFTANVIGERINADSGRNFAKS